MGIGGGIFLIAVGAVLTFAVNVTTKGFNINTIGIILMIAGGAAVLLDLIVFAPRRRTVTTTNAAYPAATTGPTVTQTRDYV
jgi:hypothetical protein